GAGNLLLDLTDDNGTETVVRFTLLPSRSEVPLDRELRAWDAEPEDSIMRYLGRAYTYRKFGMYSEAANECETALKLAPESRYLLVAVIEAERDTGNTARERELRKRLPRGTIVP